MKEKKYLTNRTESFMMAVTCFDDFFCNFHTVSRHFCWDFKTFTTVDAFKC